MGRQLTSMVHLWMVWPNVLLNLGETEVSTRSQGQAEWPNKSYCKWDPQGSGGPPPLDR